MDPATRAFMEPRFGHDFSQVRIHTDARAAESAREVHALAYTVGPNVVFGADEYAPTTHRGRGLLAHELSHTIQQRSASGAPPSTDPHGIFEWSADAAGRDIANGQAVSPDFPACGVGLARAPVSPDAFDDHELAQELKRATENLKPGEEPDWWLQSLRAEADRRAKARLPVTPAPPKAPPKPPPPDPAAERAAAAAEAEAVATRIDEALKHADDDDTPAPKATQPGKYAPGLPTSLSLLTSEELCQGPCFTDEEIYKEYNEATKRIDEQISKERKISERPYEQRLRSVRLKLQEQSDYWYSAKEALRRMTGEEVWREGVSSDLFIESEKKAVYEDQNSLQELIREEQEEAAKYARRKFESDQYRRWVAQGEQRRSPALFIQPFAFAALGPLVGAAYAGTQTGAIVGETYNACAPGTGAECAAAAVPLVAAGALHRATRMPGRQNNPLTPPPPVRSPAPKVTPTPTTAPKVTPPPTTTPKVAPPTTAPKITPSTTAPRVTPPTETPKVKSKVTSKAGQPPPKTRKRNVYPDFEDVPSGLQTTAEQQTQHLSGQLGIPIPKDRVVSAPWIGSIRGKGSKRRSISTSQGWLREERRFWKKWKETFQDDAKLLGPRNTVTPKLAKRYGWPDSVIGEKLIHHHIDNGPFVVAIPKSLHEKLSGKIHAVPTVVGEP